MARRGTIKELDTRTGRVGIQTDQRDFTVIEVLSPGDFHLGDEVAWANDRRIGPDLYQNLTQETRVKVVARHHGVPDQQLRERMAGD